METPGPSVHCAKCDIHWKAASHESVFKSPSIEITFQLQDKKNKTKISLYRDTVNRDQDHGSCDQVSSGWEGKGKKKVVYGPTH